MSGTILGGIFTVGLIVVVVTWIVLAGRRRDAAWEEFAGSIGASFVRGGLFRSSKVEAHVRQGVLVLDTYSVPSGDSSTTYTRIRAQVPTAADLQFRVFREGLVSKLDKALGAQDLEIGVPEFDRAFVVRTNDETKARAVLANVRLRQLILDQRSAQLNLRGQELRVEVQGVVRDVERLKALFEVCELTLAQLAG